MDLVSVQSRFLQLCRRMWNRLVWSHSLWVHSTWVPSWLQGRPLGVKTQMGMMRKRTSNQKRISQVGIEPRFHPRENRNPKQKKISLLPSQNGSTVLSELSSSKTNDPREYLTVMPLKPGIRAWKRLSFWLALVCQNLWKDGSWPVEARPTHGEKFLRDMTQPPELGTSATCWAGKPTCGSKEKQKSHTEETPAPVRIRIS